MFAFSFSSFYSEDNYDTNFFISSFFGSKPKALKATFNSLTSIVPEPSTSNKSNASLISFFYLSVNSYLNASLFLPFFAPFLSNGFLKKIKTI